MAGVVFISYRRSDSAAWAGRIADHLEANARDLRVVIDVVSIEPGLDYVEVIRNALAAADVVLAVIGPGWLSASGPNGPRLEDPNDLVRLELSIALSTGKRLIPVLLDGARMPAESELPEPLRPLSRRNAVELRHATFRADMQALAGFLAGFLGGRDTPRPQPEPAPTTPTAPPPHRASASMSEIERVIGEAFRRYVAPQTPADSFMIIEDAQGRFVQFLREPQLFMLDLPAQNLSPVQRERAQRLIVADWSGLTSDVNGQLFSYQAHFPEEDPELMAGIVTAVFEEVYGAPLTAPPKITIDR